MSIYRGLVMVDNLRSFLLLFVTTTLFACSSGGSDSQNNDNNSSPALASSYTATLVFPSAGANMGGVTSMTVRGKVTTTGTFSIADINFIDVNGITATHDIVDDSIWTADVPLIAGTNTINIRVEYSDGSSDAISFDADNELPLVTPGAMVLDTSNNRLIYAEELMEAIVAVDLTSGMRTVVADNNTGTGTTLSQVNSLAYDSANQLMYFSIRSGINAGIHVMDMSNSNRTLVSGFTRGSGTSFGRISTITHDTVNDTLYVGDEFLNAIFQVDIATGNRTIISDDSNGTGPSLASPVRIIIASGNSLLVADSNNSVNSNGSIIDVDPTNGNRTIISDETTGSGDILYSMKDMVLDSVNNRVIVTDGSSTSSHGLYAVSTINGARTLISDNSNGAGQDFYDFGPSNIIHDSINNRVIVGNISTFGRSNNILAVDLATGDRSILTENVSTGSGTGIENIMSVEYDSANQRLLFLDRLTGTGNLVTVDIDTGDRSEVASGLYFSDDVAYDATNDRSLVTEDFTPANAAILGIDMMSGVKTILSKSGVGIGDSFGNPSDIVYDESNDRVFVTDLTNDAILSVDLTSGDRTTFADAINGMGDSDLQNIEGLAYDEPGARLFTFDKAIFGLVSVDTTVGPTKGDRTVISRDSNAPGSGDRLVAVRDVHYDANSARVLVVDETSDSFAEIAIADGARNIISDYYNGTGPYITLPVTFSYDHENERAWIGDIGVDGVILIDTRNGNRAIMSR